MSIKLTTALAAVLAVGLSSGAQASSLPYSYTVTDFAGQVGNIDLQSITPNNAIFASYNLGPHKLTVDNAAVVTGNNWPGNWFPHLVPSGISETENYLTAFGPVPAGHDGKATFDLGAGVTNFSFLWGSIDAYNMLQVTNGKGLSYTISGQELVDAGLAALNGAKYFSLSDAAGIKQVVMTGTWDGFEAARISAVPLPAALPLFGAALAGTAFMRRRKQAKA